MSKSTAEKCVKHNASRRFEASKRRTRKEEEEEKEQKGMRWMRDEMRWMKRRRRKEEEARVGGENGKRSEEFGTWPDWAIEVTDLELHLNHHYHYYDYHCISTSGSVRLQP